MPATPPPGAHVGSFRVVSEIARGGMGVVLRAYDPELDREVALKSLLPEKALDPREEARLRHEARTLARLHGPGVVPVHEIIVHDGIPWIVMEFVEGLSLRDTLRAETLKPARVLDLFQQIVDALADAHRQGVVHRDLKPGNVIVDIDGRARVVDFGLAHLRRVESDDDATTEVQDDALGSPGYAAPEQVRGEAVDERADVFALGAVFFEMATGDRAFGGKDGSPSLRSVLEPLDPKRLEAFPDELRPFVPLLERCLAVDPAHRYTSAAGVRADLRRIRESMRARVRTSRIGLLLVAAIGLVAVGLATFWPRATSVVDRLPLHSTDLVTWSSRELDAALSPDQRWVAFISDARGEQAVWIQDFPRGDPERVEATKGAVSLYWSSDSQELAVMVEDTDGARLLVFDAPLGRVPRTVVSLSGIATIAGWTDEGIYVETRVDRALWCVDLERFTQEAVDVGVGGFTREYAVEPSGRRVAMVRASNDSSTIVVVDRTTGVTRTLERRGPIHGRPTWVRGEPGILVVQTASTGQPDLHRYDLGDGTIELLPTTREIDDLLDAGAGSVLLLSHFKERGSVFVVDPDGPLVRQTFDEAEDLFGWCPSTASTRHVLIRRAAAGRRGFDPTDTAMWIAEGLTPGPRGLRQIGASGFGPRLSADGTWFACTVGRDTPDSLSLRLIDIDGGRDRLVTHDLHSWGYDTKTMELTGETYVFGSASRRLIYADGGAPRTVRLVVHDLETGRSRVLRRYAARRFVTGLAPHATRDMLAVLVFDASAGVRRLQCVDLDSGETVELATWSMRDVAEVELLGWDGDVLLVARHETADDGTLRALIESHAESSDARPVAAVDDYVWYTASLDTFTPRVLAVTSSDDGVAVSITDLRTGSTRRTMPVLRRSWSHGRVRALADGRVAVYGRRNDMDLWIAHRGELGVPAR